MKKFATLLPENWLAETPQTFAARRLGRQSAERERFLKTTYGDFAFNGFQDRFSLNFIRKC
ncbi:hypothetical protein V3595_05200 [Bacillus sp. CFBP9009]